MRIFSIILFAFTTISIHCQQLTSSNLPIIIINTNGVEIPDEPKINADLRIIFNADGSQNIISQDSSHFEGKIGIELRGQSSLSFPKKGYGFEIRDELDEDLDSSIMNMPKESDWVIHSPYSDKSLIRNALAYTLAGKVMDYAPRVQMAELRLNGEYKGVVLFTEKIIRDKNRVDISKLKDDDVIGDELTGGYILRFDKIDDPKQVAWMSRYKPLPDKETRFIYHYPKRDDINKTQKDYIRLWIDNLEFVLNGSDYDDPNDGYRQYLDVNSFIDFMLVNELTRNVDGYRLSTYMYKKKDSEGGLLHAGPVWDFNLAFGNADYCQGGLTSGWAYNFNDVCPGDFWVNHFWWKRLISDYNFLNQLKERWQELREGEWSDDAIFNLVNDLSMQVAEAQVRNFQKYPILGQYVWPNNYVGPSYGSELDYLREWIKTRLAWMDAQLQLSTNTIDEFENLEKLVVYPNPSSGLINIEVPDHIKQWKLMIFDSSLKFISEINQTTSQLELTRGLYHYRLVSGDNEVTSGSFLIEH